jgi:lysophospholipase L1-like esterase
MSAQPKFPLSALGGLAVFAAIMVGVHFATGGHKGMDLPSALQPIPQFPHGRTAWVPFEPIPVPGVPEVLAPAHPPIGHMSPALASMLAANPQAATDFLNDSHHSLDHFYAALRTEDQGHGDVLVRIVHYGDSPTTADLITGDARQILQQRFGNGGPGFLLIARPWAWYGHNGVDLSGDGWDIDTAVNSPHTGAYGLGGAVFTGSVGAYSRIKLQKADTTVVELQYLSQPNGGTVEVLADGSPAGQIRTAQIAAGKGQNGAVSIAIPPGTKSLELRVTSGTVKLFGVALGREGGGLTYDSIGLNGASTTVMSRNFDEANFASALQHRRADLVIINYGTNESTYLNYVNTQYETELRRAIARVHAALPQASILIMSPMDRGLRGSGNAIGTYPAIPVIVQIQERVALDTGCAFFNTYQAMGGEGTMERWYDGHPRMVSADLIHPSPQGARIVAQALTSQLLIGYERYVQTHPSH